MGRPPPPSPSPSPSSSSSEAASARRRPRRSSSSSSNNTSTAAWATSLLLLLTASWTGQAFQPASHLLPARPAVRRRGRDGIPRAAVASEGAASSSSSSSSSSAGGGSAAAAGSRFVSPAIPASASVADLLEYLGDTSTRRRAARRLMQRPEEVPSAGLASLVEATARLGNTSGVQKLLAMMREVGDAPTAPLYEGLLKMANKRFYWDLALALLHEAETDGLPLTAAMLGSTLHSCLQADRPREAVNLLKRFEKHGVKPGLPSLMALIRLLSEKGMIPALRQVSTALATLEVDGDAALYTALLGAFGRAGSYDDVLSSAGLVEGRGLADKGRIYSTAVASLLEGDLVAEARELYDRAIRDGAEVSPRGYEALVWGAALSSDPAQAAFFIQEMRSRLPEGASIPPKVYWRPIVACLRAGRLAESAALVEEYYCEVPGTAADPVPLNNLVKAACDSGKAEDRALAVSVYEAARAAAGRFVGNSFTAMVLVGAYRAAGQLEKAVALHQDMRAAGVEVWLPAASNLMHAYGKLGMPEEELAVFHTLAASPSQQQHEQQQPPPAQADGSGNAVQSHWARILSRAMFLAKEHGKVDTAATALQLLQRQRHLRAGAKDYTNLIQAFSAAKRPEDALQVLVLMNKRKEKPGTLHYNAVMHAFARADRMGDAEAVFEEMKMRQIPVDAASYNMLISGFERQRQPDRALLLYDEMTKKGIVPDAYVLNSLISVTADLRNRTLANSLLQRFRSLAGGPASDVMYGSFMHALGKADATSRREVFTLLEEVKAQGRVPNAIMYNEALYAAYRLVREDASMADRALALFHEMVQAGVSPDPLTYRRLFKCLKQARRFQDILDVAAPLPRDLLVGHERIGVPVVAAALRQGDQARALDLLGDIALRPNASYATLRWAAVSFCTRVSPPDTDAAEAILGVVEERGWRPDRGFHHARMRGLYAKGDIPGALEVWFALPERFQGGDAAAVALLCHMDRGRLERVPELLQVMRAQDDVGRGDLMVEILARLLANQDFKPALDVVELMLDYDVALTKAERGRIEALVQANPKGPALEVLEGVTMCPLRGGVGGGAGGGMAAAAGAAGGRGGGGMDEEEDDDDE